MTNTKTHKKMKVRVKGAFQKLLNEWVVIRTLKNMEIDLKGVKHISMHETELIIVGEEKALWRALNVIKNPLVFLTVEHIKFEFIV